MLLPITNACSGFCRGKVGRDYVNKRVWLKVSSGARLAMTTLVTAHKTKTYVTIGLCWPGLKGKPWLR